MLKQQPQNKNVVEYLTISVLEAARNRIRSAFERFSTVAVAFSGGKDSLVLLSLVETMRQQMGIKKKLRVIFRDEELLPDCVIEFVQKIAESGDFDFRYYCVPLKMGKVLLGKKETIVAWDEARKDQWVRQPPPYAIRALYDQYGVKVDTGKLEQYDLDPYYMQDIPEDSVILTGVRADESLLRLTSLLKKKGDDNWIANPREPKSGVYTAKPVYDWSELDIFKYMYEEKVDYCPIYDHQLWSGSALRVATPLHENAAKNLPKVQKMFPVFYAQLCALYPDVDAHMRYWNDVDPLKIMSDYSPTFDGIRKFISETVQDESTRNDMMEYVRKSEVNRRNKMSSGEGLHNLGGWPVYHVFTQIIKGTFKKSGSTPCSQPSDAMFEFEGLTRPE